MQDFGKNIDSPAKKAHIIVTGNEKGGCGKSTISIHLAIGLLRLGYSVATIDLDSHQATLTSYLKNRWRTMAETRDATILNPEHVHIDRADSMNVQHNREEDRWRVDTVVSELSRKHDFIIIDTPGNDRFLSIVGHSYADTLVTPMNDSFIDLDVIAKIDPQTHAFIKPSIYAEMVADIKLKKDLRWFLMRNRLSPTGARNKQDIADIVENLQAPLDYTLIAGLTERVVFRELFLKGLTLLDLHEKDKNALSMSHINARQEVRNLIRTILPRKEVSTMLLLQPL